MDDFVLIFKALADETRFKMVNLLFTHDLCVGGLAHRLGVSSAAVSQHLRILRKAGLVRGEKRGYWTHYSVEKQALDRVVARVAELANRSAGAPGVCLRMLPMASTPRNSGENEPCTSCRERPHKLKLRPDA